MTIIQQLVNDHAFFKKTFAELENLSASPDAEETVLRASELVELFRDRHRVHLRLESSVLYPALLGYLETTPSNVARTEIYHHMQDEHMGVGRKVYLLEQDLVSRPLNTEWLISFRDLAGALMPHMQNEEDNIFPEALRLMPHRQLETMARSEFFPVF